MGLDIVLNKTFSPMFQALRRRLLRSYLSVIAAILGTFATAVYVFFACSLYRQLDNELLTLAKAAAPSLAIAKKEVPTNLEQDIPWSKLFQRYQSLEWFDVDGKLLTRAGPVFSTLPLRKPLQAAQQHGSIRTLTLPVYGYTQKGQPLYLEGYVRASESTEQVEKTLTELAWGLGLGGLITLGLSGIGGLWLTRQSLQPVEQSFDELKQFTADASHELRSPLTVIKTSLEVMLLPLEPISPLQAKRLAAIASATQQMTHLVEDLLFLARTDSSLQTFAPAPLNLPLDELLQEFLELIEPQAEIKGITLTAQLQKGVRVMGNAAQLTQLFANLLKNALHYTPSGGTITVAMSLSERGVMVRVKDTGIGIAPEHLPLVFRRFWRADSARSYREEGLGLGLSIAQAIAHRHGGNITVSSQVGVGSCFQVYLPRHP